MQLFKKTQIGPDTFAFDAVNRLDVSDLPSAPVNKVLTGKGVDQSPSFEDPPVGSIPDPVVTALASSGTIVVPMTSADVFTITPSGACTFTTTAFKTGKRVVFSILTSGTTARTLTWSTGFKPSATLSTGIVSGKYFTVTFLCVGSLWIECNSRLGAI